MQGVLTGQQEVNDAMTAEERARAVAVLEKEFGPQWQTIVQMLGTENLRRRVGKELTSFIAYPAFRNRRLHRTEAMQ